MHFNLGSGTENISDGQRKVIRRQIAWLYSLVERLRTGGVFPGLKNYISEQEYEEIKDHENIPNSLQQLHQKDLKEALSRGRINEYQQLNLDSTITRLTDHMGMCEPIKTTVFPTIYIRKQDFSFTCLSYF